MRLFLPALPHPQPEAGNAIQAGVSRGGTETILVVEDEPSIRELARAVLAGHGYRVLEADCAAAALEVWAQERGVIDLLFTDMVMPGAMNGRMLAEELSKSKPELRVLFTTGYTVELTLGHSVLKAGVNLIPKPYTGSLLASAVRRRLDGLSAVEGTPEDSGGEAG